MPFYSLVCRVKETMDWREQFQRKYMRDPITGGRNEYILRWATVLSPPKVMYQKEVLGGEKSRSFSEWLRMCCLCTRIWCSNSRPYGSVSGLFHVDFFVIEPIAIIEWWVSKYEKLRRDFLKAWKAMYRREKPIRAGNELLAANLDTNYVEVLFRALL